MPKKTEQLEALLQQVNDLLEKHIKVPAGTILAIVGADIDGFVIRSNACEHRTNRMIVMVGDWLISADEVPGDEHATVQ